MFGEQYDIAKQPQPCTLVRALHTKRCFRWTIGQRKKTDVRWDIIVSTLA